MTMTMTIKKKASSPPRPQERWVRLCLAGALLCGVAGLLTPIVGLMLAWGVAIVWWCVYAIWLYWPQSRDNRGRFR